MKASSFRYLWEQVVFKKFLEFQAQFPAVHLYYFKLVCDHLCVPLSRTEGFLLIITKQMSLDDLLMLLFPNRESRHCSSVKVSEECTKP